MQQLDPQNERHNREREDRTKLTPACTIGGIDFEGSVDVLDGFGKLVLCLQDFRNGGQSRHGPLVEVQGAFESEQGGLVVVHLLGKAT